MSRNPVKRALMKTIKISDITNSPIIKPANNKCKLINLFNIVTYIQQNLNVLKNLKFRLINDMDKYPYFYFNYITEVIINISNNLVILKDGYEKIKINKILLNFTKFCEKIYELKPDKRFSMSEEEKEIIEMLMLQLNTLELENKYNVNEKKENGYLNHFLKNEGYATVIKDLEEQLKVSFIISKINSAYNGILEINKINNDLISFVNTNYSLKYLNNYVSFIKVLDNTIKFTDFVSNRFYPNDSKFPINITSYQSLYFPDNKFETVKLEKIKEDLFKKYYDYDFNEIFATTINDFSIIEFTISVAIPYNITYKIPTVDYVIKTDNTKFKTGFTPKIIYSGTTLKNIDKKSIFSTKKPFDSLIEVNNTMYWYKKTNDFVVLTENIPLVSLEHVKQLIQIIGFKIMELIDGKLKDIIKNTIKNLHGKNIPDKIVKNIEKTLDYLEKNDILLKKVIIDKLIIFLNSYIKILINEEINSLVQEIFIKDVLKDLVDKNLLALPYKSLPQNKDLVNDISKFYNTQLHKYTIDTMIPKILSEDTSGIFKSITDALIDLNGASFVETGKRKLLLNKCVADNRVDILKDTLLNKINLRTLDRNGNTILNRLIDQYNEYAISKVLELDKELYTYKNNRGQNSIEYLFEVLNKSNSNYTWEALNKRIKIYESDLQVWIKSENDFGDIELDESKHMIYNIILNSLYLFNESMWLILLKAPYGWKYEDKIKLKDIIKKQLKYDIEENLLIKSLTDSDKKTLKGKSEIIVLNNKIDNFINALETEIAELENTNKQLEEEKKTTKLGKKDINVIINKNNNTIVQKTKEIVNLKKTIVETKDFNTKLDSIFTKIETTDLIKEMNIEWKVYDSLVLDNIWNYYLPIVDVINNKNTNVNQKYISYYNYSLLNLDYNSLDEAEIQVLINYYTKIINNVYGDYYDLEKYEDSEFNYINDTILNIIYLNVVNVIEIEMFSGIIGYISSKYTNNAMVKEIIEKYKDPRVTTILEIINNLLKTAVWNKLDMKNKDYPQNYTDSSVYEDELKSNIKTIFILSDSEDDEKFIENIAKFYKGLVENVSFNINNEIVNLLNDMKKNSLLFGILNLINKQKNKK